jgi:hypothetical protein
MAKNTQIEKRSNGDGSQVGIVRGGSIADVMKARGLSLSRQVTLQEGDLLTGTFLGAGAPVELESKNEAKKARGEKDTVSSWRIKAEDHDIVFLVLGSAGLDKHLAPLAPGVFVAIQHMGTVRTAKGMNVNDFAVAVSSAAARE